MYFRLSVLSILGVLITACTVVAPPSLPQDDTNGNVVPLRAIRATTASPLLTAVPTSEAPPAPSPLPTITHSLPPIPEIERYAPDDPRIRYIGRFDFQNPAGPAFDWSASAIELVFNGSSLTLFLEDGRNSYNLVVDGREQVLQTEIGQEDYLVAEDLSPGDHHLRLAKRTEALVGAAVFKGVQISGGGLLRPSKADNRRLEFIGDSITTGYGNEGQSPDCWFTPETQNAERSYAAMTADALGAEYSLVALSGLGVVRNLRAEDTSSPETAIDFIDRALGMNPFVIWPPENALPDAVVINLGTNDYSSVPFPADDEFVGAYVDLLRTVRMRYPEAAIFAVAGPLMLEPAPQMIAQAVEVFAASDGYDHIKLVEIEDNLERSGTDFGCDWHPNIQGHEKIAAQLVPVIADELEW